MAFVALDQPATDDSSDIAIEDDGAIGVASDEAGAIGVASEDDGVIIISDEEAGAITVSEDDGAIGVASDEDGAIGVASDELMTGAAELDDTDGVTGVTTVGVPRLKIQIRPMITITATMMIIQVLRFMGESPLLEESRLGRRCR